MEPLKSCLFYPVFRFDRDFALCSPQIGWGRNSRENATGLHSRGLFCDVSDAIALEDDKIFCLATPKKKPTHKFNGYLPLLFSRHSELVQKDLLSVMFRKKLATKGKSTV